MALDRAKVGDQRLRVVAREPEHRHVGVRPEQAFAQPILESVEVDDAIDLAQFWRGNVRAVADSPGGVAITAHANRDSLPFALKCRLRAG